MDRSEITQEFLREILDYNPDTGDLVWKTRDLSLFASEKHGKTWNKRNAGKVAQNISKNKDGYLRCNVCIGKKTHLAHRIIWMWMTGEWPKNSIDHIDRNATNNKWSNLREASLLENNKNQSMQRRNTSGVTGVSWRKDRGHWKAQVRINGKEHHLGSFPKEDLDLAAMEVMEFRTENGFHPSHGLTRAHYIEDTSE